MKDFGYVALAFDTKDIVLFEKLVHKICKKNDFYYSDVVNYIRGDISSKLHLTIFYGLIDEKVDKNKLREHLKRIDLRTIKLGKIFIKPGYQNLYQVLCVEVLDESYKLESVSNSFKNFAYEESVQLEFKPHLTLAYVKPEYKLGKLPDFPKEMKVLEIKYFDK